MASALYDKYKESMLIGPFVDLDADTIRVSPHSSADYTFSAAHQFYSSIVAYTGTTPQTLGSITGTNGVFNAASVTFTAVSIDGVKVINQLDIHKWSGAAGTSQLCAYFDGFSVTPNGGDITVVWDTGVNKIWKL